MRSPDIASTPQNIAVKGAEHRPLRPGVPEQALRRLGVQQPMAVHARSTMALPIQRRDPTSWTCTGLHRSASSFGRSFKSQFGCISADLACGWRRGQHLQRRLLLAELRLLRSVQMDQILGAVQYVLSVDVKGTVSDIVCIGTLM